jgi:hypothetical protein
MEEALNTPVAPHERLIEYEGQTLSITEWANKKNIPYSVLSHRLGYGWSMGAALNTPVSTAGRPVEYAGRALPLTEWAKVKYIPYQTLCTRIYTLNWSLAKALETPVRKYKKTAKPGRRSQNVPK